MYGEAGRGKTHLLHIWAEETGARVVDGAGLRLPLLAGGTLGVDDADLAGEEALLHTVNACAEAGHTVLLASREAPARWMVRLPDLQSRLRATTAVGLAEPSDAMRAVLLSRLLSERQLVVLAGHQAWMLEHLPRSAGVLREVAARLDRASLAMGRAVTRALLADVVERLDEEGLA